MFRSSSPSRRLNISIFFFSMLFLKGPAAIYRKNLPVLILTSALKIALAIASIGTGTSTIFLLMVVVAAFRYRLRATRARAQASAVTEVALPPVTILKPIHGMEQELDRNLDSFFNQNYPDYEIVFGARDATDPAVQVVERVCSRHPQVKTYIVFTGPPTLPNAKVFSLERMMAATNRSYFVITDSDVQVSSDFLRNVVPPLLDPRVGLVTCMYQGLPASDFWSSLEALGLSVEMSSGVIVADMVEGMRFALGPALAVRRDVVDDIGGIAATADYYSDDFELGHRTWAKGYQVVLSHQLVRNVLTLRSPSRTLGDQLRWMKSTRYSRPLGHLATGLTFAMPFGALGLLSGIGLGYASVGFFLFILAFANRMIQSVVVGWRVTYDPRAVGLCWLYPLRDFIGFFLWLASYTSRRFYWRGETYRFGRGGRIIPEERSIQPRVGQCL